MNERYADRIFWAWMWAIVGFLISVLFVSFIKCQCANTSPQHVTAVTPEQPSYWQREDHPSPSFAEDSEEWRKGGYDE